MKKEVSQIKLSIITPYYNTLEYTKRLAEMLEPQLTDEIEWIIIDDGCHEQILDVLNATIIHLPKNSGGASIPRNYGLDIAKGKYITFIDSDDRISKDYIQTILDKINNDTFDYCYFNWCSHAFTIIIEDEPPEWNCSVWNCIYKRKTIGKNRFNPELVIGEDYDFNIRVRKGVRSNINKMLYFYSDTPNSLMKRDTNAKIQ